MNNSNINKKGLVSVIIPTYNNEEYIEEAIESVLSQSYKKIELIVVDDGSTDMTYMKIKKYLNYIRYIKKTNGGVASASNIGIDMSTGEYIAFLDGDDVYTKNKIEMQVKVLENNKDVDFVYNDVEVVDEKLQHINILCSEEHCKSKFDFASKMFVRQLIPGPASIMIRRKCIEDGLRYPERYTNTSDYYFTLKLSMNYKGMDIKKVLYRYRRHKKNLTNNHSKQVQCEIDILKDIGMENVKMIVEKSSFDIIEKKVILAKVFMKIQEYLSAKVILESILDKCRRSDVFFYLGNCYYNLEEYKKSIKFYEASIEINKNMAESYNNMGCCYHALGNDEKAICNFRIAQTIRNSYLDAKNNIDRLTLKTQGSPKVKLTMRELRKELTVY